MFKRGMRFVEKADHAYTLEAATNQEPDDDMMDFIVCNTAEHLRWAEGSLIRFAIDFVINNFIFEHELDPDWEV